MNTKEIEDVLDERGKDYGEFIDNASISQNLQDALMDSPKWNGMSADCKEAMTVITQKFARMLSGNSEHHDSWLDIEGYARLVRKRIEEEMSDGC